ncbi:hypothetical protein H0H87_007924 [Tephrocybe sp. NHM501043]|nr:hypothetical protein H0H87_007924 [Tephrocybe sp. NHM501043]
MPTFLAPVGATPFHSPNDPPVVVPKAEETDVSLSGKKKKKKKRRHEEGGTDEVGGVTEKRKKKKKKRRLEDGTAAEEPAVEDEGVQREARKKKKDKSRDTEPQIDPSLLAQEQQGSATALLSAIVAAATGSQNATQSAQPAPQIDPAIAPHNLPPGPIHLNPYMAYVYGHQSLIPRSPTPPPSAPSTMFPTGSTLFPTGAPNVPFSELNFGSNEDVLRALQSLDMAKITSVLKNIGEVTAATNADNSRLPTPAVQAPRPAPALAPIRGNATQFTPPVQVQVEGQTFEIALPATSQPTSEDHQHLLTTKWMSATKLGELAKSEGLVYKKGKFSASEEERLEAAIENYRVVRLSLIDKIYVAEEIIKTRGLTEDQIQDIIFPAEKSKDHTFWAELTSSLTLRPIIAVYHHIRRTRHPLKRQGIWTADEDSALHKAVVDHGQAWEKISPIVGRMPADCRDRYRNHIVNRDIRVYGYWSKEEEEQLTRIVTEMTIKQGKTVDDDIFWGRVSELMGGTRGRQQCRIKWTDALAKDIKAGGKARWGPEDAFILVHKVAALNVNDDTEIDWKLLPDPGWNIWSAHSLQRRWLTMKRGIKGWEEMSQQEILDILRVRKQYIPRTTPSRAKYPRKISSATFVDEAATEGVASASVSASDVAGSSTGPGTLAGYGGNNDDDASSSSSEPE